MLTGCSVALISVLHVFALFTIHLFAAFSSFLPSAHDKILEASYGLISDDEKDEVRVLL